MAKTMLEGGVKQLIHQGALATAAHTGDGDQPTEWELHTHILEIVAGAVVQLEAARACQTAFRWGGNAALTTEVGPCEGLLRIEQILQRSLSHDVAAVHTGTRTDVHHMISSTNRVFIVFHHHEGVTQITQPLEGGQQAVVIALMQADARFIEHVEHPGQTGADLRGQTNALRFAA